MDKTLTLPKILIVDDKLANMQVLESILEDIDVTVIPALSGKEALTAAIHHDFALILMDVQMPIMDGFETAKLLFENTKTKHIPIIFVTAHSRDEKDVWKGYETGAVDYIFKPVQPAILNAKIKIFLEIYHKKHLESKYSKLQETNNNLLKVFKNQDEYVSNILIVDNVKANIQSLEKTLEKLDVTVIGALSGKEALSTAVAQDFALILITVEMPVMDGFETAKLLFENTKTKHIPIIFITEQRIDEEDVLNGYEIGAVDYLFKPIEPAILTNKIKLFIEIDQKKKLELKYSKLLQTNDVLRDVFKNQNDPEQKSINNLDKPFGTSVSEKMHGGGPLEEMYPDFFNSLVSDFKVLVEKAIETQVFKVGHNLSDGLNKITDELGAYKAGPRDVLKIYVNATQDLNSNVETDEKKHVISNEAKLLMIELMGNLVSFYRAGYFDYLS